MAMRIEVPRPATPDRTRSPSPNPQSNNLYFGYGSNLWQHQMAHRCPSVKYLGIGRLRHWSFQINSRGVANVVEAPPAPYSPGTTRWLGPLFSSEDGRDDNERVYGFVYQLSPEDEARLDAYEDVPNSYTKEWVYVDFWPRPTDDRGRRLTDGEKVDIGSRSRRARVMIYLDRNNTASAPHPTGTYIYKMNEGIQDALGEGIPAEYVEECLRPFVPVVDERKTVEVAIEDAVRMGVDVKKLVQATEKRLAETGAAQERSGGERAEVQQGELVEYLKKVVPEAERGSQSPELKQEKRRRALSVMW